MAAQFQSPVDAHQNLLRVRAFVGAVLLDHLPHHDRRTYLPLRVIVRVINIFIEKKREQSIGVTVKPSAAYRMYSSWRCLYILEPLTSEMIPSQ